MGVVVVVDLFSWLRDRRVSCLYRIWAICPISLSEWVEEKNKEALVYTGSPKTVVKMVIWLINLKSAHPVLQPLLTANCIIMFLSQLPVKMLQTLFTSFSIHWNFNKTVYTFCVLTFSKCYKMTIIFLLFLNEFSWYTNPFKQLLK